MAVEYLDGLEGGNGQNSATLPAHNAGDLLLIIAMRSNTSASIDIPAGWTPLALNVTPGQEIKAGWMIAPSSSTPSGTWTNALRVNAFVFTGASGVGAYESQDGTVSSSVKQYPGIDLDVSDGSSLLVRAIAVASNATAPVAQPSGYTTRFNMARVRLYDMPADVGVSSYSSENVSTSSTSIALTTMTIELLAQSSGGASGQIKAWDGSAFVAKPTKAWDGSAWTTKPLKRWDGSTWSETPY